MWLKLCIWTMGSLCRNLLFFFKCAPGLSRCLCKHSSWENFLILIAFSTIHNSSTVSYFMIYSETCLSLRVRNHSHIGSHSIQVQNCYRVCWFHTLSYIFIRRCARLPTILTTMSVYKMLLIGLRMTRLLQCHLQWWFLTIYFWTVLSIHF